VTQCSAPPSAHGPPVAFGPNADGDGPKLSRREARAVSVESVMGLYPWLGMTDLLQVEEVRTWV
jgi:hypothetical protein